MYILILFIITIESLLFPVLIICVLLDWWEQLSQKNCWYRWVYFLAGTIKTNRTLYVVVIDCDSSIIISFFKYWFKSSFENLFKIIFKSLLKNSLSIYCLIFFVTTTNIIPASRTGQLNQKFFNQLPKVKGRKFFKEHKNLKHLKVYRKIMLPWR